MISLIHPSRGRPGKSFTNSVEWMQSAGTDVELIVAVDESDPTKDEYIRLYHSHAFVSPSTSVVQATNTAARKAKGDILLYLSDDFKCFPDWGKVIEQEFAKYSGPTLLKVDDCLQPFHVRVLTIPIMNRQCYQRLGYFWHPGYKSMWVDCDLYETVKRMGALKFAPHLKFEHHHVSVGKAEDDDTYRRSAANWDQGLKLFNQRKAQNFPL